MEMIKINTKDEIVSVIMLAYNHEKWIEKAMMSVINQKTKYKYKIYIHEDCSTDGTRAIVQKISKDYPDLVIPIMPEKNRHSQGIRIIADILLPMLKGKYVMICEGDDYWTDENKIEMQISYMEQHTDCSLTFGNAQIVDTEGRYMRNALPDYMWKDEGLLRKLLGSGDCNFTTEEMILLDFVPTASLCFRYDSVNILNKLSDSCDLAMRLAAAYNGNYTHYFNRILSAYRTGNPNSASGSIFGSFELLYKHFYMRHKQIYGKFNEVTNNMYSDTINKVLDRKMIIALLAKSYSEAKKQNRFNELYSNVRLKELVKYYFPCIFKLIKKIRYSFYR